MQLLFSPCSEKHGSGGMVERRFLRDRLPKCSHEAAQEAPFHFSGMQEVRTGHGRPTAYT